MSNRLGFYETAAFICFFTVYAIPCYSEEVAGYEDEARKVVTLAVGISQALGLPTDQHAVVTVEAVNGQPVVNYRGRLLSFEWNFDAKRFISLDGPMAKYPELGIKGTSEVDSSDISRAMDDMRSKKALGMLSGFGLSKYTFNFDYFTSPNAAKEKITPSARYYRIVDNRRCFDETLAISLMWKEGNMFSKGDRVFLASFSSALSSIPDIDFPVSDKTISGTEISATQDLCRAWHERLFSENAHLKTLFAVQADEVLITRNKVGVTDHCGFIHDSWQGNKSKMKRDVHLEAKPHSCIPVIFDLARGDSTRSIFVVYWSWIENRPLAYDW